MNLKNGKNFVIKKIKNLDNANVFRLFILSVAIISILNIPVFNQDNYNKVVKDLAEAEKNQDVKVIEDLNRKKGKLE